MSQSFLELLRSAPEQQMDPSLREEVMGWPDSPTAIKVLHALDHTIFASLGSELVVLLLQRMLDEAMARENVTMKELANRAMWRDDMN